VAELVDAHGSGPCGRKPVEVQVLSSACPRRAGIFAQLPLPGPRSVGWACSRGGLSRPADVLPTGLDAKVLSRTAFARALKPRTWSAEGDGERDRLDQPGKAAEQTLLIARALSPTSPAPGCDHHQGREPDQRPPCNAQGAVVPTKYVPHHANPSPHPPGASEQPSTSCRGTLSRRRPLTHDLSLKPEVLHK
jgi:hypothetical protein